LGLLKRQPYHEPGQRRREEYVLTEAGIDFMPVVWAMFEWGRRHLPGRHRLRLTHLGCGADAEVQMRCTEGHLVPPAELGLRLVKSR
ncbi:MAG: winged helix-turn-helix transcriptional regulator, partial [Mycobacterium sp.]